MRPEMEQLLVLQDRDQKIRAVQAEQKALPREQKSLDDKLTAARTASEVMHQRGRENEVERRRLELEVQGKQNGIARFKTQQQQTRKNDEFQALNKEIQHTEAAIILLEDRELELMERAERLQQEIATSEAELRKTEAFSMKQKADLTARLASLSGRLAELEKERANLAEEISPVALDLYQRLFAKKGDAAIVPLEHEVCAGCHMKAPAQIQVQLRMDQGLVQCPNCGRILYRNL